MKPYSSPRDLLAKIEQELADNRPSFHHSPLERVAELLADGRHYGWVGIYLKLDEKSAPALLENLVHPAQFAAAGTRKKVIVAMKIAGREVGFLNVESDRENAFGPEERVLLERVAGLLAKFLTGPGKYLVRKATEPAPAAPKKAAAA
ncbi:MAG TPA: GAF domain-containing protein [Terriglobales bacterium]|nr:GAF domain-containing protein [Terriglobales bacterium]